MKFRFYTTSERAWKAMYESALTAEKSIYLEMYILQDDTERFDFFSLLKEKAQKGVETIVIIDVFGSSRLSDDAVTGLRDAGVEVLYASSWLRRLHRKLLIVDRKTAFLGGVNIAKAYAAWRDIQLKLTGRVVKSLVRSFAKTYRACGGKGTLSQEGTESFFRRTRLWTVDHNLWGDPVDTRGSYEREFENAKESIIIVTPYLIPPRWLIRSLHQAILRGVAVTIVVTEKTEYFFLDEINYYHLRGLEKIGARCLIDKNMNHAKALLIDGRVGSVGSHNFDLLANSELGVFFADSKMTTELGEIIQKWIKESVPFSQLHYRERWYKTLFVLSLRLFARFVLRWI